MIEKIKIEVNGSSMDIGINDEANLTKIYGSNGVGKTTISREMAKDPKFFVFNEDYVNENIYSVSLRGAETSQEQQKNLAKVFISKECKDLTDEIQKIKNLKDLLKQNLKNSQFVFYQNLDKIDEKYRNIITQPSNIPMIIKGLEDLGDNFFKSKKSEISNFELNNILETLDNEHKFVELINNSFLNEKKLSELKPKYEWEKLESDYLNMKFKEPLDFYNKIIGKFNYEQAISDFKTELEKYNSVLKFKEDYEKALENVKGNFEKLKIPRVLYEDPNSYLYGWVSKGIEIHGDLGIINKFCLFCGNESIDNKWIEKIKIVIQDRFSKIVKEISYKFENLLNNGFKIILETDPILVDNFKEIKSLVLKVKELGNTWFNSKILNSIREKRKIDIDKILFSLEGVKPNKIGLEQFDLKNLSNYAISKTLNEFKQNLIYPVQVRLLEIANRKINEKRLRLMKNIEKDVNKLLDKLNRLQLNPFSFEIKLLNPKGNPNNKDATLNITEKDNDEPFLKNLSTGERNNIALMLFIAQAQKKIEEKKIKYIVLDDPVDGGDFYSYFLVKSFILQYLMVHEGVRVVVLTHNFDYLLVQLNGTDSKKPPRHSLKIDIIKILSDGNLQVIDKKELSSNNKTLYYKLTNYVIENFKKDITLNKQPFLASWMIWTRKIIEEILTDNLKLNIGEYIDEDARFKFILDRTPLLKKNAKQIQNYLGDEYYEFIKGNISFSDWLEKSKFILKLVFEKNPYLKDFCGLIDNIENTSLDEKFDKEVFKTSVIEDDDFLINIAHDAAKLMIFERYKIIGGVKNHAKNDISRYLRHSSNSVSKPIIALEPNSILKNPPL